MRKIVMLIMVVMVLFIPVIALAHGGRTDSAGGHTDSDTGEYHYHHGHSAHQHPNGECPYDYNNQTKYSSSVTNSSYSSTSTPQTFFEKSYDRGYNDGYDEGYDVGYDKGFSVGRDHGYDLGREEWENSVPSWVWIVFVFCGIVIVIQFFIIKNN